MSLMFVKTGVKQHGQTASCCKDCLRHASALDCNKD